MIFPDTQRIILPSSSMPPSFVVFQQRSRLLPRGAMHSTIWKRESWIIVVRNQCLGKTLDDSRRTIHRLRAVEHTFICKFSDMPLTKGTNSIGH